jgi:hypothetical protein
LDLMGWILEQKFMTEKQVRQVFWNSSIQDNREAYRRLSKLEKAGYLKTNKKRVFSNELYLVTKKGVGQLKEFNRDRCLEELTETDYSNYRHDLAVTDIRILFHSLGYTYWLSERVLAKRNDLRWLPDGMIFNRNEYIAVECESSQKSKRRYREIFYHYELNSRVHKVLYIVSTPELVQKLLREASTCSKLHFVSLENLGNDLLKAKLETKGTSSTLHDLLESSE